MDTGHRLGLILLYGGMVLYALLLLRILVQIFFGAAIERYQEHQWRQTHRAAADRFRALDGKRDWANSWLPRNAEVKRPAPKVNIAAGPATLPLLVTQALAVVFLLFALGVASTVAAQPRPARDVSSSDLKRQLIDIHARELQLRIRLEEIDQELKPEVIERELAGIGSVHPEELRENRRKLLTIERNGLQSELDLLEEYRARIEAAIVIDEQARALLKYEQPAPAKPSPQPQMSLALRHVRRSHLVLNLFAALSILIMLAGGLIFLLIVGFQVYTQIGETRTREVAAHAELHEPRPVQTKATVGLPLNTAQV